MMTQITSPVTLPSTIAPLFDEHPQLHSQDVSLAASLHGPPSDNTSKSVLPLTPSLVGPDAEIQAQALPVFDGGRQAWLSLFGGLCAMIATFGYTNAFGVYQDHYVREGVASASSASWIGSIQAFLLFSLGFFTGPLVDRGYFRITFTFGSILYAFSLFMVSIADIKQYYQLVLAQGVGMGLGAGCIYIPTIAVQAHHWRTHRPLVLGMLSAACSIGGIVFPIMLNRLLVSGVSFASAVRASGYVVLGLLVVANICVAPRESLKRSSGGDVASYWAFLVDVPYMLTNVGALLTVLGNLYPYFYLELYAISHGVDPTFAFYTLAILNAASIPGRIATGAYVRKLGAFNMLAGCGVGYAAVTFGLIGISSAATITVYSVLAGFFIGGIFSLLATAVTSFAKSPAEAGQRAGFSFFIGAIGSLIGNPINGALLGNGSELEWTKATAFTGTAIVVGTACIIAARQMIVRDRGTQVV